MAASIELFGVKLGDVPSNRKQLLAYREILRYDPCSYCGLPYTGKIREIREADHIRPCAVMRGDEGWGNLTAACPPCNRRKQTRTLLDFLVGLGIGVDHREQERRRLARWRANASTS